MLAEGICWRQPGLGEGITRGCGIPFQIRGGESPTYCHCAASSAAGACRVPSGGAGRSRRRSAESASRAPKRTTGQSPRPRQTRGGSDEYVPAVRTQRTARCAVRLRVTPATRRACAAGIVWRGTRAGRAKPSSPACRGGTISHVSRVTRPMAANARVLRGVCANDDVDVWTDPLRPPLLKGRPEEFSNCRYGRATRFGPTPCAPLQIRLKIDVVANLAIDL
jgi:hypothetical protein